MLMIDLRETGATLRSLCGSMNDRSASRGNPQRKQMICIAVLGRRQFMQAVFARPEDFEPAPRRLREG